MAHSCLAVAKHLLEQGDEKFNLGFSPMKIIKLVYIAHGWMLGVYAKPLINEQVEAWKYGPVIRELYHAVKEFRDQPVDPKKITECEDPEFDNDELAIMETVLDKYRNFSAIQLSQITHAQETPWDFTYNKVKKSVISNELIEDHYRRMYQANVG